MCFETRNSLWKVAKFVFFQFLLEFLDVVFQRLEELIISVVKFGKRGYKKKLIDNLKQCLDENVR